MKDSIKEIIINGDNPNIIEVMDYLNEFYIIHEDYRMEFTHNAILGVPQELLKMTLHVYTDELATDGNLDYLIAEESIG